MRSFTLLLFTLVASAIPALGCAAESATPGQSSLNLALPLAQVPYRSSMAPSTTAPVRATAPYQGAIGSAFSGPKWISATAILALEATGNLRGAPPDNAYNARDFGSRTAEPPQHRNTLAGDFAGWIH
jgi:hypothetical protein